MELTAHEKKILDIVKAHSDIVDNPEKRGSVAKTYGLSEKTLRNRIAELKKRGLINLNTGRPVEEKKPLVTDNDEINLAAVWDTIRLKRWLITKISTTCTMAGLIYALIATIYFESTISMYPAGELGQTGGGVLGEFQGLAKSFGLSSLGPGPTYNIPDIIESRRLKKDIVLKNWKTATFPKGTNLIKFWELDKPKLFSPRKWMSRFLPSGNFSSDPQDELAHEAILELEDLISANEEISGLITVTVLMQDPNLAADIANYIAEYVKKFISIEQKLEATRNRKFVEQQKFDAKDQLETSEEELTEFRKKHPMNLDTPTLQMIRSRLESTIEENRVVYNTLRQQYEIAKNDEAKEKLRVNMLDQAEPAVKKAKPRRTLIVILSFLGGFMIAVPISLFLDRKEQ
ncbi:MAG: GNVR domain-containing protein [Candidatus Neomarinimicrobiota bacterium]|nr:GNVR domain-containing protein [Candidatus Neomarinimicrobiota bacterium]